MKVLAINGGPRKGKNTATLLQQALEGAAAAGAETELIHLYDLDFKGCRSCFACKLKDASVPQCVIRDGLYDTLGKIVACDALVLGSPIFFGDVTSAMHALLERLLYPYLSYDGKPSSFPKTLPSAFIYVAGAPESMHPASYQAMYDGNKEKLERFLGPSRYLVVSEVLQFDDYSRYAAGMFNAEERKQRHLSVFEEDKARARAIGASLLGAAND